MSAQEIAIQATPPSQTAALSAPPPRRRWRRRLLVALICLLALLSVPTAGYLFILWYGNRDLQAAIEETDRGDPRWRLDDVLADREAIPDDKNSALVVMKVDTLLRPGGGFDLGRKFDHAFEDLKPERRLDAIQDDVLRKTLLKHSDAVKLARTLKDYRGEGRYPIKYTADFLGVNLEPLQRSRSVAQMLQCDAWVRAEDGDMAGAMQSCRAGLALSRAVGDEPILIAALVRVAEAHIAIAMLERTLAQGRAPDEELKAMLELIRRDIDAPLLTKAIRGERAGFDALVADLSNSKLKLSGILSGGRPTGSFEEWVIDTFPALITQGRPQYLRLMNKAVEASKLPPEQQGPAMEAIDQEVKESRVALVRLLMPALSKVSQAHRRNQANLRCALCAIAAERYRMQQGDWPASLQELVDKGFLDAVPTDPFDGQPLRYKRVPGEGVIVYSVSYDGEDNGGVLNRQQPMQRGSDWGFQLWDESRRRQPPLPPKMIED